MLSQEQIEKLELYHKGELNELEKLQVEQIFQNEELREEAVILLNIFKGFNAIQLENFENTLHEWELKQKALNPLQSESINQKKGFIRKFFRKYSYAAASVVLILMLPIAFILIQKFKLTPTEKLFTSTAGHFNALVSSKKADVQTEDPNPINNLKEKAIEKYDEQKYNEALKLFEEYCSKIGEDQKTVDLKLYIGLSNLFTGNTLLAKPYFQEIISKEKSDNFREAAEWYLALCYLKEMNSKKSLELLHEISKIENHTYQKKAASLINDVQIMIE